MVAVNLPIALDAEKLAAFCRERGIRKLSLFGSVLRDDFDPDRSDVDVLVEFQSERIPGWDFFTWDEELARIIGHKVDLCSRINPIVWPKIAPTLLTVYEQP
jgi:predicted nucleotidyltransferase